MAKGKRRNSYARFGRPELSTLDSVIYDAVMFVSCGIPFGLVYFLMGDYWHDMPQTALGLYAQDYTVGLFLIFLPVGMFALAAYGFGSLQNKKQPLLGRKDISYGQPWEASLYPLFRRSRQSRPPTAAAVRRRKEIGQRALLFAAAYIILATGSLLGILPHNDLRTDLSITQYNSFNMPIRHYEPEDYTSVTVDMYSQTNGYRSYYWAPYFIIQTSDGRTYWFKAVDFASLSDMLAFKEALPPELVTVYQSDAVLYSAHHYSNQNKGKTEIAALYALFEMEE